MERVLDDNLSDLRARALQEDEQRKRGAMERKLHWERLKRARLAAPDLTARAASSTPAVSSTPTASSMPAVPSIPSVDHLLAAAGPKSQEDPGQFWPSSKELAAYKIRKDIQNNVDMNITWTQSEMEPPMPKMGPQYGCPFNLPPLPPLPFWFSRNTPLHQALVHEDFEAAKLLIRSGANPDIYNSQGRTPLHEALFDERRDAISFLLKHGADPNAPTTHDSIFPAYKIRADGSAGVLPLHLAMWAGDIPLMRLLLDHGASYSQSASDTWNLLDLALLAGDSRAMAVLMSHGLQLSSPAATSSSLLDEKNASKELVAVSMSNQLVPAAELFPVYRHALSRIDSSYGGTSESAEVTLQVAETLIDDFFANLRDMADMMKRIAEGDRCSHCSGSQSFLHRHRDEDENKPNFSIQAHQN